MYQVAVPVGNYSYGKLVVVSSCRCKQVIVRLDSQENISALKAKESVYHAFSCAPKLYRVPLICWYLFGVHVFANEFYFLSVTSKIEPYVNILAPEF